MQTGIGAHADDETLEQYAMGRLPEARLAVVEEHLLVCSACQDQLKELDDFVAAMRRVAPRLRSSPESAGHRLWSSLFPLPLTPRVAYAGALAAVVLLLLIGRGWQPGESPQPALITLSLTRGPDAAAGVSAPADRPLGFQADVSDLARHDRYTLEIVDTNGRQMFRGDAPARDGQAGLATGPKLRAGMYFVRLYSPNRKLLREFGLTVR